MALPPQPESVYEPWPPVGTQTYDASMGMFASIEEAYEQRRACNKCGTIYDTADHPDIHFPHDEGCEREGCACDNVVCSKCCWECE